MSEYKLVPFEPTPEMIEAAEEAHMPFGDVDLALRMAILAAPDVQWDVVGWQFYQDGRWWNGDDRIKDHRKNTEEAGYLIRDVYVSATCTPTPQPAPDVAGLMGVLGQYFDAMDSIGREGTATSTLIAEAKCDEAEARLRLFLAAHRKQGGGQA